MAQASGKFDPVPPIDFLGDVVSGRALTRCREALPGTACCSSSWEQRWALTQLDKYRGVNVSVAKSRNESEIDTQCHNLGLTQYFPDGFGQVPQ